MARTWMERTMAEATLQKDGHVAVVTLRAPQRRNALTTPMVRELVDICEAIDADPDIGAVVVQAEGESFCAGADRAMLNEAGRDPSASANYEALSLAYRAFVRVGELQPPTIAAVRGHAVGAGVNLMLATDLRVVAQTARIMPGFHHLGLHPGGGHFILLGRLGGREAAAALSVFGQQIDGQRAAELGLAWEALPEADVEPRAVELAREAGRDPELARATVRSFRLELGPPTVPWQVALEAERAPQMWSLRRRAQQSE
jgi:enoyl-CoA hydratase